MSKMTCIIIYEEGEIWNVSIYLSIYLSVHLSMDCWFFLTACISACTAAIYLLRLNWENMLMFFTGML